MAAYSTRLETVEGVGVTTYYLGTALIGGSEESPIWRIKRITDTGSSLKIEFAGGNSGWVSKWSDRLILSYS
jgi:hypothetical protein